MIIILLIFLLISSPVFASGWYSTLQGTASDVEQTPPPNGVTIAYNTTDHEWEFNYGLAPAGGTTGTCLEKNSNSDYDYSWVACSGGGGTPGGSNTQVQFNSSGSFSANSGFTYVGSNVGIGSANPGQSLDVQGTVRALNFIGAGTGLSGTAAGLSIGGNAATATSATTAVNLSGSQTQNYVYASPNGSSGTGSFRALVGADLPNPSASTLGGIESLASTAHQWINTISTSGVPSSTQPAQADITGLTTGSSPTFTGITLSGLTTTLPVVTTTGGQLTTGTFSGNTTKLATTTGSLTNTHCVQIDSSGNFVDAGGACTVGGGGGTVASGTIGQEAVYTGSTTVGSGIITDNGTNVGIGTTTPGQRLDVSGTVRSNAFVTNGGTSSQFVKGDGTLDANSYLTGNQNITLSGDISGSGTTAITTTLPTVNSNVGTFQGLTVNGKGQVTAASNQNYLTGNQNITLSGAVTGSGSTSIATTLANLIVQTANVNWPSINGLPTINSGGINWTDINLHALLNNTGINWQSMINQTQTINWSDAQSMLGLNVTNTVTASTLNGTSAVQKNGVPVVYSFSGDGLVLNNSSSTGAVTATTATQTQNTVLGAATSTALAGLSVPSCSTASSALTWTTNSGFGCNSISGGAGSNYWLQQATGNVGIYTVSPNGVGIGTSTFPTQGLSVIGNVGIATYLPSSGLSVGINGVSIGSTYTNGPSAPSNGLMVAGNVSIGTKTAGSQLNVGSTGQLSVDSSGNISTSGSITTSVNSAGGFILSANTPEIVATANTSNPLYIYGTSATTGGLELVSNNHLSSTTDYIKFGTNEGLSVPMIIQDNSGVNNIGIGTLIPLNNLAVVGSISLGTAASAGNKVSSNNVYVSQNIGIGTWLPIVNLDVEGTLSTASFGGNVGIGTWAPGYSLAVNTNPSYIGVNKPSTTYFANQTGDGEMAIVGNHQNELYAIDTAGEGYMGLVYDPGSAVAANSPLGEFAFSGAPDANHATNQHANAVVRATSEQAFTVSNQGTQLQFYTTPLNSTSKAQVMTITAAGNVGIGSASPQSLLVIKGGDLRITGTAPACSSCGTCSVTGSDNGFRVTVGSSTTCTATFNTAKTNTPSCVCMQEGTSVFPTCTVSSSAVTCSTVVTGKALDCNCMPY